MIFDLVAVLIGIMLLNTVLLGLLLWVLAGALRVAGNTPMTYSLMQRFNALFTAVGAAGTALSGQPTGTGLPAGVPTGAPNGTGFFNTQGLASGSYGSTHQHTLPNFPTATHTHDFDGHTHNLPVIP